MTSVHRVPRAIGATAFVLVTALITAPAAFADPAPADPAPGDVAPPPVQQVVSQTEPISPDAMDAVSSACRQFAGALDLAASNYEDFAYNSAGGGNSVDYQDPTVANANVVGRTALRASASEAMSAASTPGLPNDVAAPMRSWSLRAAKLLLIMGLRGGGDTLNSTATDMNTDAGNVQMACALNGARA